MRFHWSCDQETESVGHFVGLQITIFSDILTQLIFDIDDCFLSYMFLPCHVHVSEWIHTLYSCLNVKEIFARSRCEIWSLSDCNWTRTHCHLNHKRTLNHSASLAKWLSVRLLPTWLWVRVQLQSLRLFSCQKYLAGFCFVWRPTEGYYRGFCKNLFKISVYS